MAARESKKKPTKSVLAMVIDAIRLQPAAPNGVSRVSIAKYLKSEFDWENSNRLKQALKKGVADGKLVQTGQSFRVAGDPVAEAPPEAKVVSDDQTIGNGPEARSGDTVVVKYEGKLSDGAIFDSAPSFEFTLGAGEVIRGWDIGVAGMQVGGIRKLEVPSKLGYGKRGSPPDIPPNSDLFFTITLKKIK